MLSAIFAGLESTYVEGYEIQRLTNFENMYIGPVINESIKRKKEACWTQKTD